MSRTEIESRVRRVIAEALGVMGDPVDLGLRFDDEYAADSLDMVELLLSFEDEFDIEIDDGDTGSLVTGDKIVDYVLEKSGQ